jgi:hypothetical protein
MSAARSKVPIQSVSNDRRIGALPPEQSPAASGFIAAPRASVMFPSYAIKAAAHAQGLIGLCATHRFNFWPVFSSDRGTTATCRPC